MGLNGSSTNATCSARRAAAAFSLASWSASPFSAAVVDVPTAAVVVVLDEVIAAVLFGALPFTGRGACSDRNRRPVSLGSKCSGGASAECVVVYLLLLVAALLAVLVRCVVLATEAGESVPPPLCLLLLLRWWFVLRRRRWRRTSRWSHRTSSSHP